MNTKIIRVSLFASAAFCGLMAGAVEDRPVGIRIGNRMTLKPYIALSGAYDTNVDGRRDGAEDFVWTVNPGLGLEYKSESWLLFANAWYQYNALSKGDSDYQNEYQSYGEDLTFRWTDALPDEAGWAVMFSEKYQMVNDLADFQGGNLYHYNRDRQEFKGALAIQRRFGRGWHADLNGSYYWLDYDTGNKQNSSLGLYGWERWLVGGEVGYAASKWTDILIAGSYQGYDQDNRNNNYYYNQGYSRESGSKGVTLQGGIGSFATDRITYRVLGGWSRYKMKSTDKTSNGFTYTVSGNWAISDTWKTMILANSYYQPNEREYACSTRVDELSWGIAHAMVENKLNATFDIAYRREGREMEGVASYDYDIDVFNFRLGLTYIVNQYLQLFGNAEFRKSINETEESTYGEIYDYDRFRLSLGLRFTY